MRKIFSFFSLAVALGSASAFAQPPREGGPEGRPGGEGFRPMVMPLIEALDADHNREISAEEIANASKALATLDKNGDGKLTPDEMLPNFRMGGGRPDGAGRPEGGRPDGPRPEGGRPDGAGRPEGRRPDGAGRPEGARPDNPEARRPGGDGDRPSRGTEGDRPPRGPDGERGPGGPGGERGPGGPGFGGPGGPGGGPPPERFVQFAMQFDDDKDEKLSKEELMKFAENLPTMRRGMEGPGGGFRPGGPEGRGPGGPEGRGPGGPGGDRPRPERPTRPDTE